MLRLCRCKSSTVSALVLMIKVGLTVCGYTCRAVVCRRRWLALLLVLVCAGGVRGREGPLRVRDAGVPGVVVGSSRYSTVEGERGPSRVLPHTCRQYLRLTLKLMTTIRS